MTNLFFATDVRFDTNFEIKNNMIKYIYIYKYQYQMKIK